MSEHRLAPDGWSVGPWVYPDLHDNCPRAAADLYCVRPCCRTVLQPGEWYWQRESARNAATLMMSPGDAIRAVARGYVTIRGERWPASWEDPRDPWVVRVTVPEPARLAVAA